MPQSTQVAPHPHALPTAPGQALEDAYAGTPKVGPPQIRPRFATTRRDPMSTRGRGAVERWPGPLCSHAVQGGQSSARRPRRRPCRTRTSATGGRCTTTAPRYACRPHDQVRTAAVQAYHTLPPLHPFSGGGLMACRLRAAIPRADQAHSRQGGAVAWRVAVKSFFVVHGTRAQEGRRRPDSADEGALGCVCGSAGWGKRSCAPPPLPSH